MKVSFWGPYKRTPGFLATFQTLGRRLLGCSDFFQLEPGDLVVCQQKGRYSTS